MLDHIKSVRKTFQTEKVGLRLLEELGMFEALKEE